MARIRFFEFCAKMDRVNVVRLRTTMIFCTCWILIAVVYITLTGNYFNRALPVKGYISSVSVNSSELLLSFNSTTINSNSTVAGRRTDVLLVAYMRTGSSFLGKVLGWRDDVFFWFEPLRKNRDWQYLRGNALLCHHFKPLCEIMSENASKHQKIARRFLLDIFDCNLQPYDSMPTDINFDKENLPPSWIDYAKCKKKMNSSSTCNVLLVDSCKKAKYRITKVLRLDLEGTVSLLDKNPRLKIVQLLRDPRAIINSHLRTWWTRVYLNNLRQVEDLSIVTCARLRKDILTGKALMKLYPDRVRLVQYEDFKNLDEKVGKLFKFLNMESTSQKENILRVLKEENSKQAPISINNVVYKNREGFHPFLFREQMDWKIAEIVHKHCGDVLKELGLRQFKTKADYVNLSKNVVISKLPFYLT